jgi:hypothetical protein
MAIVTLDEARAQLQIRDTDNSQDAVIQAYCDAITPVVEEKANEIVDQRSITEEHDLSDPALQSTYAGFRWTNTLWLRNKPCISLTSVTNLNNGFTWTVGNLHLRPDGRLRVITGTGLYGYLSIVQVAGYTATPFNYKQFALTTIQYTWEQRRGVGNVSSGVMGLGEQISPDSFMIPPKAYEWLGPPTPGGP